MNYLEQAKDRMVHAAKVLRGVSDDQLEWVLTAIQDSFMDGARHGTQRVAKALESAIETTEALPKK